MWTENGLVCARGWAWGGTESDCFMSMRVPLGVMNTLCSHTEVAAANSALVLKKPQNCVHFTMVKMVNFMLWYEFYLN